MSLLFAMAPDNNGHPQDFLHGGQCFKLLARRGWGEN